MKKIENLVEGQLVRYVGKNKEELEKDSVVKFLGYDSHGWEDVWVESNGKDIQVCTKDLAIIEQ